MMSQLKNYPLNPTTFPEDAYNTLEEGSIESAIFCRQTWEKSIPFIYSFRNAVDIGCRDGEYTRHLQNVFNHVFCFDPRKRPLFSGNVIKEKVTHFTCALGNTKNKYPRVGNNAMKEKYIPDPHSLPTLDSFDFKNIDYIKIDTDGYEYDIIQGGLNTIQKYRPLIVCETDRADCCTDLQKSKRFNQYHAIDFLVNELNYIEVDEMNNDIVLIAAENKK